eukprot:scaffold19220_cov60-Phaeocystis_antarctica.AAC.1
MRPRRATVRRIRPAAAAAARWCSATSLSGCIWYVVAGTVTGSHYYGYRRGDALGLSVARLEGRRARGRHERGRRARGPAGGGCRGGEGDDTERRDEHNERRRPCAAGPAAAAAVAPSACARGRDELDERKCGGGVDRPQLLVRACVVDRGGAVHHGRDAQSPQRRAVGTRQAEFRPGQVGRKHAQPALPRAAAAAATLRRRREHPVYRAAREHGDGCPRAGLGGGQQRREQLWPQRTGGTRQQHAWPVVTVAAAVAIVAVAIAVAARRSDGGRSGRGRGGRPHSRGLTLPEGLYRCALRLAPRDALALAALVVVVATAAARRQARHARRGGGGGS